MISFIGYYNYTVILTYISLFCSIAGMLFTVNGWYKMAVLCLALSGLCDMFDGKIARRKTDRTDDEKCFGIQIDSLCDMVCFGAFPILLAYSLGMRGPIGIVILAWYGMNGVVRLGYFNVCETKRQEETEEVRKYYSGLPITSIAVVLPLVFVLHTVLRNHFAVALHRSRRDAPVTEQRRSGRRRTRRRPDKKRRLRKRQRRQNGAPKSRDCSAGAASRNASSSGRLPTSSGTPRSGGGATTRPKPMQTAFHSAQSVARAST